MEKILLEHISNLIRNAEKQGLILSDEKEINYGVQLKFTSGKNEISLNVYHSAKKGISNVIGAAPDNPLKPVLQKILNLEIDENPLEHRWQVWAGTDESGKGDFFGPLVVCGFICRKAMLPSLIKLGVRDSKQINDKEIEKIAKQLFARFMPNIETIVLLPAKYNELYQKFRDSNKKLNEMLAWMHARVILNLNKKHDFEGAVVDKFASDRTLLSSLKDLKEIKLQHKVRAEQDLAVASASIIARYLFLKNLKELSKKHEIEFPKGASTKVIQVANEFSSKYGKSKLSEVAKIHFKTYNEINN
ncbi:MAG: ribonuclease HIII [Syntrophales bacterium]|nr:ribonuclease HIII [Syntrophales bacterium]